MTKERLVVKLRDNGKQVSRMSYVHYILLADHHRAAGTTGGILSLLIPRNAAELMALKEAKKKFVVEKVKGRKTDNPEKIFENIDFLIEVAEWYIKKIQYSDSIAIKRIAKKLADEQFKIVNEEDTADEKLVDIFEKHAPSLLTHLRGTRWWSEQLAVQKKRIKNNRS